MIPKSRREASLDFSKPECTLKNWARPFLASNLGTQGILRGSLENRRFAVIDSVRENGVKLNADPYDTPECPCAIIRPVCGDSPPRLELSLLCVC